MESCVSHNNIRYKVEDIDIFINKIDDLDNKGSLNMLDISSDTIISWKKHRTFPSSRSIKEILDKTKFKPKELGVVAIDRGKVKKAEAIFFGKKLEKLLNTKGITKKQFADEIKEGKYSVTNWCNGTYMPKKETITKIADYFGVSTDYFYNVNNIEKKTLQEFLIEIGLTEKTYNKIVELKSSLLYRRTESGTLFPIENKTKIIEVLNFIIGNTDFIETFSSNIEELYLCNKEYEYDIRSHANIDETTSKQFKDKAEHEHEERTDKIYNELNKSLKNTFNKCYKKFEKK